MKLSFAICALLGASLIVSGKPVRAEPAGDPSARVGALEGAVSGIAARLQIAQLFNRPPAQVPEPGADQASLLVRIDRLENQVRAMNGQIEQLQFGQRKLEETLRKFQQDVDFRFGESAGGRPAGAPQPAVRPAQTPAATPGVRQRRGDAFDPAQVPDAPGVPRPLGGGQQLAEAPVDNIMADDEPPLPSGPLDLTNGGPPGRAPRAPGNLVPAVIPGPTTPTPGIRNVAANNPPQSSLTPQLLPTPAAPLNSAATPASNAQPGNRVTPGGTILAGLPPATPREEFELAVVSYRNGQLDDAETAFRSFTAKYPRDRLVPDAVFYLGETYYRRNRPSDAAEQFLKVTTDYSKSARAPESLVRLGLSLEKIGAKEQACAAWAEVGRKYPTAPATTRANADREAKRAQC